MNIQANTEDLQVLFLHTKEAYNSKITFEKWCEISEDAYLNFIKGKENTKTYSQWVNGQIIALT